MRGGAITMSGQGMRFLLQVASTMALARLLTPADFGLVAMVTAITGFLSLYKDLGLSMATVQRTEIDHTEVSTLFWVNVLVSVLLAVLVVCLSPLVAWLYREPSLLGITVAMAAGFILSGLGVQHAALLQRQMRFGSLTLIDLTSFALGVGAGIGLAVYGAGYWALVAMPLVTSGSATVGYWFRARWRPGRPRWGPGVKGMLAFGGYLTGFNTVNYLSRNLDNVLIGWRWGAAPLGLYSRAYQLLLLPLQQINQPTTNVMIPALSRLQNERERYRRAYLEVLEKMNLLTLPLIALLVGTADWVVDVFLGPQWHGAAGIFVWLSIAALAQPVTNTTGWLFITQRRTRDMFVWGLVGSGLSIASFVVGLPYGPKGVAAAYAVSGLLIRTPLVIWYVGRKGPVSAGDIYRASIRPWFVGLGVLGVVLVFRRLFPELEPLPGLLLATLVVIIVLLPFMVFSKMGREALKDLRHLLRDEREGSA